MKLFHKTHRKFYLLILVTVSSILRLMHLGYSDFQGDEIKALFLPKLGQTAADFLLIQRKGPVQFLITYLLKFVDPTYDSQLLIRLPFALAGILSVYFFYRLVERHYSAKVAFYASFFLATNGFFVAFSRIVQYQSFVILFMILALHFFSLAALAKHKYRNLGVYLGFIFWALSILSHYDGIFIAPFAVYLLYIRFKPEFNTWHKFLAVFKHKGLFQKTRPLFLGGTIFIGLLLLFYIPFILNLDAKTLSYWTGRIKGTGGKLSSSTYLFSVYQPIYVIHIYIILFGLGSWHLINTTFAPKLIALTKSLLKFSPKLALSFLQLFLKEKAQKSSALLLWFLVPFIFLEVFVDISGTHIYTYLVPAFIFLGFGIEEIERVARTLVDKTFKKRFVHNILSIKMSLGVGIIFLFIFAQTFAVFVEHKTEYPWEAEKFFLWEFSSPSPIFHLSMFGFPYHRHWDAIGDFIVAEDVQVACPKNVPSDSLLSEGDCPQPALKTKFYSTNERKSIARYHIPFGKDTDNAGYFVHIVKPQSFTNDILSKKAAYWAQNYPSVRTYYRGTLPIAYVYYMPQGSLEAIKLLGY